MRAAAISWKRCAMRTIIREMKQLTVLGKEELATAAKNLAAPGTGGVGGGARQAAGTELLGGRDRDAGGCGAGDAMGAEACVRGFGGSSISDPANRANAIVMAARNYNDPGRAAGGQPEPWSAMPGRDFEDPGRRIVQTRGCNEEGRCALAARRFCGARRGSGRAGASPVYVHKHSQFG